MSSPTLEGQTREIIRFTALLETVGGLFLTVAMLIGLLLTLGAGPVAADGDEEPGIINWYRNGPGMITIEWVHTSDDVYWFVVEQESPYAFWQTPHADTRIWNVTGLAPNTTYRYRVCAVYDSNRVCSEGEDGSGWVAITTMPPEQQRQQPPPQGQPPPPSAKAQPLHSPVIRARPLGDTWLVFTWVNPLDPVQHSLLTGMEWQRDGRPFAYGWGTESVDSDVKPSSTHRYKLCIENPVNKICSADIVASPAGVAASFKSVNVARHYIRHRNFLGVLTEVMNNQDADDVAFAVRPPLTGKHGGAVSLQAIKPHGHFLRHQGYRLKLHRFEDSQLFRQDATFLVRPGLIGTPGALSFEAVNFPGHFIRHQNSELWLAKNDNSRLFASDASFEQEDDWVSGVALPPTIVDLNPAIIPAIVGAAMRTAD